MNAQSPIIRDQHYRIIYNEKTNSYYVMYLNIKKSISYNIYIGPSYQEATKIWLFHVNLLAKGGSSMKITLVKTREGCALLEKEPRYNVLLNGILFGQLYFNMRGYIGGLPDLYDGRIINLNIGEASISAYRKEVSRLNKEFKHECSTIPHPH